VEETAQEYFIRLERYLFVLDTITTMAPLLGLLGTIIGMTRTFNLFEAAQKAGDTTGVLNGVAEALYATASGIAVALICFAGYNFFASRLRDITAETAQAATRVLNVLSTRGAGATQGTTSSSMVG